LRSSLYSLEAAPTENTSSSVVACWFTVAEICLPHRCVATRSLLRDCLPTRCLVMNYSGFQASCQYMYIYVYILYISVTSTDDSTGRLIICYKAMKYTEN
jgi:hypothetical protein